MIQLVFVVNFMIVDNLYWVCELNFLTFIMGQVVIRHILFFCYVLKQFHYYPLFGQYTHISMKHLHILLSFWNIIVLLLCDIITKLHHMATLEIYIYITQQQDMLRDR